MFGRIALNDDTNIHRNNNFQSFTWALLVLFRWGTSRQTDRGRQTDRQTRGKRHTDTQKDSKSGRYRQKIGRQAASRQEGRHLAMKAFRRWADKGSCMQTDGAR